MSLMIQPLWLSLRRVLGHLNRENQSDNNKIVNLILIQGVIKPLMRQPVVTRCKPSSFKVCVTAAGRNDRSTKGFATVDWMAYQGAPDGGVAGKTRLPEWWTGSQCKEVKLPQARIYENSFL